MGKVYRGEVIRLSKMDIYPLEGQSRERGPLGRADPRLTITLTLRVTFPLFPLPIAGLHDLSRGPEGRAPVGGLIHAKAVGHE